MPALDTATDLLNAIRHLGLLEDPGRLTAFEAASTSAPELAARLVKDDVLTAFQAERLAAGEAASLVFRQYVLLEQVGAGGMGQVFKARHRVLGRVDAVKVIRAGPVPDADTARRFRQEARLAARCSHPNLVTVYDADEADGVPFIAMEFVPGTDLHRLVHRDGPLPIGVACEYIRQGALGLHHAHERGLVHRDVKPANLLVAGGHVRVADLGLARLSDARQGHPDDPAPTGSAVVMGTPDFIAPEQCVSTKVVDRRADVYALGCTLYFLITGRPPFPGGTMVEKMLRHLSERPTPIRELCPDVPVPLASLLDEIFAHQPDDRPPTAEAVAERLAPFCSAEAVLLTTELPAARDTVSGGEDTGWAPSLVPTLGPVSARAKPVAAAVPIVERHLPAPKSSRRVPPVFFVAAGIIVVALTVLGVTRPWSNGSGSEPRGETRASEQRPPAVPPSDPLPLHWKLGERKHTHGKAGYALAFSPRGDFLVHIGGDSDEPAKAAEVRVWRVTDDNLTGDPVWTAAVPDNARSAAFAPDGSAFAVGCGDLKTDRGGRITIWSPDTEKPLGTAEHPLGVLALAFAPTGHRLVSGGRDGKLRVWDVSDPAKPKKVAEYPAHDGPVQALAFDRDGSRLASGGADGVVKLWSDELWQDSAALPAPPGESVRGLGFLEGGTLLVAGLESRTSDGRGVLRFWDLSTPRPSPSEFTPREKPGHPIFALTVAPDDRTLFVTERNPNGQGLVRLIDGPTRTVDSYLWDHTGPDRNTSYANQYAVAVSPNGKRVATTGADASLSWWEPAPGAKPPPPQ